MAPENTRRSILSEPHTVRLFPKYRTPARNREGLAIFKFPPYFTADCIALFQEFILINEEVVNADPGIYTWLLKVIDGQLYVLAAPVYSGQEIGTLHNNIDQLTKPGEVRVSGELKIIADAAGKRYEYNTLSSLYKESILPKLTSSVEINKREHLLTAKLTELGVPQTNIQKLEIITSPSGDEILPHIIAPIVNSGALVLTPDMVEFYKQCGLTRSNYVPPSGKGGARHSRKHKRKVGTTARTKRASRRTLRRGQ